MALGIACAGTGLDEAIDLLEPMMKDSVDFVRQGAFVAVSMVMIQVNEAQNPKVASIRKQLQKAVSDRHEDAMAKFGAGLALGIIDAGGRNATIGLQTPTGNLNMAAIVGMAIFTQYWYWFPLTHFLALSFTPTAIIGVDQDLEVPSFKFHSNTKPSMFDYPPEQEVKAEEAPEKVKTAVLSTTAQAKRRKIAKDRQNRRESMDVDQPATPKPEADSGDKMDEDMVVDTSKVEDKEKESSPRAKLQKEKVGHELENMSRVLPSQVRWISFPSDGRYQPVKRVSFETLHPSSTIKSNMLTLKSQPTGGVILLEDTRPSEEKSLLELKARKKATASAPTPGQQLGGGRGERSAFESALSDFIPVTPGGAGAGAGGAAAAAGVLNAVDEDVEGGEEAPVPDEFEVESEDEDEDYNSDEA
jgi:26S proteasome regulatory subunit N2